MSALRRFFLLLLAGLPLTGALLAQETHLVVITGVAGDEAHAKQFHTWATAFIDAAKKRDNVPAANTPISTNTDICSRVTAPAKSLPVAPPAPR